MNKNFLALAAAGSLVAAVVVAQSIPPPSTFYGCKDGSGNVTSIREGTAPACKRGQTLTSWNNQGPAGVDGTNGTNGTNGTDGKDGLGLHVWKDANGDIIGPDHPPTQEQSYKAMVEMVIQGRRVLVPLMAVLDSNNAPTPFATFTTGGFTAATRYYSTADCTGTEYQLPNSPFTLPGYDPIFVDYYGPGSGRTGVDVAFLSDTTTVQSIQCVRYEGPNGSPHPYTFSGPVRTIVGTFTLTNPPPFTLE